MTPTPSGPELPRHTDRDREDAANLLEPWEDVCPGCTHVRIDGRCSYCADGGQARALETVWWVYRWTDDGWACLTTPHESEKRARQEARTWATREQPCEVRQRGEAVARYPKEASDGQDEAA